MKKTCGSVIIAPQCEKCESVTPEIRIMNVDSFLSDESFEMFYFDFMAQAWSGHNKVTELLQESECRRPAPDRWVTEWVMWVRVQVGGACPMVLAEVFSG